MALHILHTADWHLGQTFFGYDREEEHEAFLAWLLQTLKIRKSDVLLIAGDVFDVANPSASAQRRFFHFLKEANRCNPHLQIVIIAGNHDSAIRLESPIPLLEELNTHIVGVIRRTETGEIDFDSLLIPLYNRDKQCEAWCLAVPYLRQGDYPNTEEPHDTYLAGVNRMYRQLYAYANTKRNGNEALIAMGHLHATGAELSVDDRSERIIMGGLEAITTDTFDEGLAYTALGHIHKAQRIGGRDNLRYAGSPLAMSFSETNYHHQLMEVMIEEGHVVAIDSIAVPVTVELLRVPKEPLSPEEVLIELAALPERTGDEKEQFCKYPYLEVQVLLTEPAPTFRHQVEEVLKQKAVRLTSIIPSYPKREDEETSVPLSFDNLQRIAPLDMLKHTFTGKYGGELPEEIAQLFNEVVREVSL